MNRTAVRTAIVALVAVLIYSGTFLIGQGLTAPKIVLPDRDIRDLPLGLGRWYGEKATLDENITRALHAERSADRIYRDSAGHVINAHSAVFSDYMLGINHSPLQCYRVNGWNLVESSTLTLEINRDRHVPVSLTQWELNQERVYVVYWYQLGEDIILDRVDLGTARWKLRGQVTWPSMTKVLLQTTVTDPQGTKDSLRNLGEHLYRWINELDLLAAPGGSANPPKQAPPEDREATFKDSAS